MKLSKKTCDNGYVFALICIIVPSIKEKIYPEIAVTEAPH